MAEFQRETIDLREYIAILKARKWFVLLIVAAVVGSALAASYAQTPAYTAEARLLILPTSGNAATPGTLALYIGTETQLLSSEPVAALVKEDLALPTPTTALLNALEVSEVPEASVLKVTFSSTEPEAARDVANSFASNYLAFKQQRALQEAQSLQDSVQAEIEEVTQELGLVSDQLAEAGRKADFALASSLEDQRSVLLAQLGVLQQEANDVPPSQSAFIGGEVIEPAQLPTAPSSPNHIKDGLLAAFLGLALAIALAFLRERLADKVKSREDAEKALGVPVLATIPLLAARRSPKRRKSAIEELTTVAQPKSAASEAYRNLRTNLQFIVKQRSLKSVLVTSATSSEGKTVTSSNLAVATAQAGKRVILVSADMRRPQLEGHFNLERSQGLSNWLMGEEPELANLIVDPGIPNLRILPCGTIPANPAELLTSINVSRLIRTLEANADLVIIDAPPALAVADANIIASVVGGVLMVIHGSLTHRSGVIRAQEEIERAGGTTIGTVLNAWDQSNSAYYKYGSSYEDSPVRRGGSQTSDGSPISDGPKERSRLRIGSKP